MKHTILSSAAALLLGASLSQAATVTPYSYEMDNGNSGTFNYWDDSYNGAGDNTVNGARLTGGTGDLTDGIIATQNWQNVEGPRGSNGPYVGWLGVNPTIFFNFDNITEFTSVTFHFDDSNNGGVDAPLGVTINGLNETVVDNDGSVAPFAFTMDVSSLSPTDRLEVNIQRRSSWIFLSEVEFNAVVAPVPLPAGGMLLLSGLAGLALARKRSNS